MRMAILAACRLALGIVALVLCLAGPSGAKMISITGSSYGDQDGDAWVSLSGKSFQVAANSGASGDCGGDFEISNSSSFPMGITFSSYISSIHADWKVFNQTPGHPSDTTVTLEFTLDPSFKFPTETGSYQLTIPATVTGNVMLTASQGNPVDFYADFTGTSLLTTMYFVLQEESSYTYYFTNEYKADFTALADLGPEPLPEPLPEPSTMLLLGAGLAAMIPLRRKFFK